MSLFKYETLIDVLRDKVYEHPNKVLYTFLSDGETENDSLTYRQLDQKASAISSILQKNLARNGERVLLLYPPGLEYISAFWGCVYAGMIAVPCYPPRLNRPDLRLQVIAKDSQARIALTTPEILASIEQRLANVPELNAMNWLTTHQVNAESVEPRDFSGVDSATLVFMQYTSGSTAQPKGVMLSHGNLLHNLAQIQQCFNMNPRDRSVIWLPPFHDMGLIGGLLQPIYTGFSTILMPPTAFLQKPARWLQAISRYRATISGGPNFAYDFCVEKITDQQKKDLDLSSWEVAFNGAEPIHKKTLERFAAAFADCGFRQEAFYACYGLAESTLFVSGGTRGDRPTIGVFSGDALATNQVVAVGSEERNHQEMVSCGTPSAEQELLIVDPQSLKRCADNTVGEIWLAGPSVARGYWNRPEETAQTFQGRLADNGQGNYLRTGDQGFLFNGQLYIAGRVKDLIIIRGRNHYPQDIEFTVEKSHEALVTNGGAAFSVDIEGEEKLVIVQEVDRHTKSEEMPQIFTSIRQAVADQHELQVHAVVLIRAGSLPRTTSFKIQRRACRTQFLEGNLRVIASDVLETETPAEHQPGSFISRALTSISDPVARQELLAVYLQEQVARILHVPTTRINLQQPIHSFGLDSIMAIELKYALERELHVSLPIEEFLRESTLNELAAQLGAARSETSFLTLITHTDLTRDLPLSYGQRALWFLHQLAPESGAYNIASAVLVHTTLNFSCLELALQTLIARHSSLRTIFPVQGEEPVQRVLEQVDIHITTTDASTWSHAQLNEFLSQEAVSPFDLEHGPLMRILLFSRSNQETILLLVVHHIIADFWSLAVLADELAQLYMAECEGDGKQVILEPLPLQYADYARWQAHVLAGEEGARLRAYWEQKLSGELPLLDLPTDYPRPPVQTYSGRSASIRLNAELSQKLKDLSQRQGATLYMTLLAALQVLLYRYTGQTDILVGSPTAGRRHAELARLTGYFVNPVVLRADLSQNLSFIDFLTQVRQTVIEALAHQEYPFYLLVEHLQPKRDPSRSPIFQVMFALHKTPQINKPELAAFALNEAGSVLDLHGLLLESIALEHLSAQFDLTLTAAETVDGVGLSFQYNRALFEQSTIQRMLEQLHVLLNSIITEPGQSIATLPLLPDSEREMIIAWNKRHMDLTQEGHIHELFEAQVNLSPEEIAVICETQQITYHELNSRANQLAHYLRSRGVKPGARIGLCMERSIDMLVGLFGVLKAGCAYIPLDPVYPKGRLAYMLNHSRAQILLTQTHLAKFLPDYRAQKIFLDTDWQDIAAYPDTNLLERYSNDLLAYIIYTSGSTGTPKGVQILHRSVVNFLNSMRQEPGLGKNDVLLSVTTLTFDIAALELFLPLVVGARLVLASRAVSMDGMQLMTLVDSSEATCMQATPATWRLLLEAGWSGSPRLKILCGGDTLSRDLANSLLERCGELWNMYGPTETTIWSSTGHLEDSQGPIPLGSPIANTKIYIVDHSLSLVPIGVPGELVIGGNGLALGYFERPDLTAEKFIPDPFAGSREGGARLYRTGDLARFRLNEKGQLLIEFLGRLDHQVKIRGFRIELAEIEEVLNQHPALSTSVVMAQDWGVPGEKHLIAYVVLANGTAPTPGELRSFLREKLPEYMLPSAFVTLESLPLTFNGKIDRKALPLPKEETIPEAEFSAPSSEIEQIIAQIWKETLQLEKVSTRDNFFDLGGHSLLMARVHRRLREALKREISMVILFQYPTIDSLTKYLRADNGHEVWPQERRDRHSSPRIKPLESGIAIIAMAGRFPGAMNIDEFWQNLTAGVESIRRFTEEELAIAGVDPGLLADPNFVPAGAPLDEIDTFDAAFFGYSPREAETMDPQHRIFLECAWEALERAGYDSERYAGRIGVYASAGLNSYLLNNLNSDHQYMQTADGYQIFISNDKDFVPTRVSYKLNLRGPSVNVQTACSSSLVAIHLARQSLLSGECDMALAGGISIQVPHRAGYVYQERGIASPDGHCRAFDARAGGTVRGNGAGVVVLKRLSDAIAHRDTICAIIRGSALSNDGSLKVGYTAPSIQGQAEAISEALDVSGVNPETIGYIEAHGTGTEMGDPIEVTALTQAFRRSTNQNGFCAIGSVKPNIGHLDTAAGVAGLIKTVLALQHQMIPPSLNFEKPNPKIDFENSPFYVNSQLSKWKVEHTPLRAGVSSFGVGGTNAHVVLEAAPARAPSGISRPWQLLVLSAKTESGLAMATTNLIAYLKQHPEESLADIAYTLQTGRRVFNYRRALVCLDHAEAIKALEELDPRKLMDASEELKERPVAFMFTGQGSQYTHMGADLYKTEPLFRQEVDRCAEILLPLLGLDPLKLLFPDAEAETQTTEQLHQTRFTQPALFMIEYAMARLWMAWGLQPNAMIGHSIGEYVAACLAGVFSLDDALMLVAERGRLMQSLPSGAMLAVSLPEKEVLPLLGRHLSLAAVNASHLCVISGSHAAVTELESQLDRKGVGVQRLHTSHAFHSAMMDPILETFQDQVARVKRHAPQLPIVSNVSGEWLTADQARDPTYWTTHLRHTVRFAQGVEKLLRDPKQVLLEVGPGRTLNTLAARHSTKGADHIVLSSLRHPQDQQSDSAFLMNCIARLWLSGVSIDWARFYDGQERQRLTLPTYPFDRQRFWVDANRTKPKPSKTATKVADMADWFYVPSWKRSVLPHTKPDQTQPTRWLLFSDEYGLGVQLTNQLEREGQEVIVIQANSDFAKINDVTYHLHPGRAEDYDALLDDLRRQEKLPQGILHLWNVSLDGPNTPDDQVLSERLDRSFYSLLFLAQALGKGNIPEEVRMIVLSNHLHEVTGEEQVQPEKAGLFGPIQIIPLEYPRIVCRSVDIMLPAFEATIPEKLVDTLLKEIQARSNDVIVAYRGQHRWIQTFEPVRLEQPKETNQRLRKGGTYLITGGLGGMGLTLAKHIAQTAQTRLVLLSRTALPNKAEWATWLTEHDDNNSVSQKIQKIQEIEQLGAQVLVIQADVTDPIQMQSAVAQSLEHFGPIHGVIHAAGVPGGGMIQLRTRDMVESVMSAKVKGSLNLVQALKNQRLDFMILCSSINAVVGRLGQVDYIAANAFLDTFANAHPELPIIDINWETWREVGMAAETVRSRSDTAVEKKAFQESHHPWIRWRHSVNANADMFMSQMQVSTCWELNEHRLLNEPTLPGTAYLEMARAAFETHTGLSVMEFHDVIFLKPLILESDGQKEVCTLIKKHENGFVFSVMSRIDDSKDWHEHARGSIYPVETLELPQRDLIEIKERCKQDEVQAPLEHPRLGSFRLQSGTMINGIDPNQTDQMHSIRITDESDVERRSMEFGPRWRTLQWARLGTQEGLGFFELPKSFIQDMDVYKLHPALLDFATSFLRLFKSEGSYLPLSYKRLRMNRPLPLKFYSHARFVGPHLPDSLTVSFDLSLLDEQGKELIGIEEFTVIRIGSPAKLHATRSHTSPDQFFANSLTKNAVEGVPSTASVSPTEGLRIFERILSSGLSRVIVSTQVLSERIEKSHAASRALILGDTQQGASRTRHPRPQLMTIYAAPRNQVEQKLAEIWQEALGLEQVGVHDNFFELGGDSLLITRVHAKFLEAFDHKMSVANLMQYPTIAMLADQLQHADHTAKGPSFDAVRERTNKQKEAMQSRKQKLLKQRQQ